MTITGATHAAAKSAAILNDDRKAKRNPLKTTILVAPYCEGERLNFAPVIGRDISTHSVSYYSPSAPATKQVAVILTGSSKPLALLCDVVRIEDTSGTGNPMFIVGCEFNSVIRTGDETLD